MMDQETLSPESDFDPMADEFTADQHRELKRLREESPVAYSSQFGGFWALTRRADLVNAARNHEQLINSILHTVPHGLAGNTRPLMHSDQPEHTIYKDVIQKVLGSDELRDRVVSEVRQRAKELVAKIASEGSGDLATEYADPLMGFAITSIFNIEEVTGDEMDRTIRDYVIGGQVRAAQLAQDASARMFSITKNLLDDRRENPRDPSTDLATALVQAQEAGILVDEEKVLGAQRQPLVIVWLATAHTLTNIFRRLLTDHGLTAKLRAEPELIADSVDEFLRMDQPQIGFARSSTVDLEFGGRRIPAGSAIALVFPAGNRDPEAFEDPETFMIGRTPNPHLAFGHGIHSCPGRSIARGLVQTAIEELLAGTADFELSIPVSEVPNEHWPFRASLSLPATVQAR
ncbi:cytochrome P450 [Sinomonas cellulolyticus]|uniref:Cytochrome P450 n=1 Tax=Sinomonas cellulolyticus TaxID=2801916 RepID=A0ABS1K686_9MICC|nr:MULTISPECIES: cytochrome P450 [Sinomonas]MBL0707194.1 cytochrome P450 [Sinomonas cellulolyticus]GHG49966.1 cytochrome P450 [Sinomonas sp. KCTC 49339]